MKASVCLAHTTVACLFVTAIVLHGCTTQQPSAQRPSIRSEAERIKLAEQQSSVQPGTEEGKPLAKESEQAQIPEEERLKVETEKTPQEQDKGVNTEYRIAEAKREYGELRLSVATSADLYDLSTEQVRAIAEIIMRQYQHEDKVALFFYNSGRRPDKSVLATDLALCRFDWTPTRGLSLRFDQSERRERKPEVLESTTIPKYEVLETFRQVNGRENGSVLVPSFSRQTPPAERERVARLIMAAEGFDNLYMYATREALEADDSRAYSQQHPRAKEGILGAIIDGTSIWK